MRLTLMLLCSLGPLPVALAGTDCAPPDSSSAAVVECAQGNAPGPSTSTATPARLPEAASAEVERLRAEMRFMLAIGNARVAEERKQAMAAIYEAHGMSLPADYGGW